MNTVGITTIDTGFVRPYFAASHLLIENNHVAFIDVGTTHSVPRLLEVLRAKNIPVTNVDYVIVTHVHLDHAGGAGKLMQALPNAKLVVHPRGAYHLINPNKLITSAISVYGAEIFQANYGKIIPVAAERVIQAENEQILNLQGRPLLFLDTPGHAKHHFCVFDIRSKSFFTGDTFGISYREFDTDKGKFIYAATTPTQFEPLLLHKSINRLLSYHPTKMYLTHYGEVNEVTELADKLHDSIDKQVEIIKSVAEHNTNYHDQLVNSLFDYFLAELQDLGCTIPISTCRKLLQMDVELNAQGLTTWWEQL